MNITEAQALLEEAYPDESFKIGLDFWHWSHYTPPKDEVEWLVSIIDQDGFYKASTLEIAVKMALDAKVQEPIAETEEAVAAHLGGDRSEL